MSCLLRLRASRGSWKTAALMFQVKKSLALYGRDRALRNLLNGERQTRHMKHEHSFLMVSFRSLDAFGQS